VPDWVKAAVDEWLTVARIEEGLVFRCVTHSGAVWGSGIREKVVWWIVRQCAKKAAIDSAAPYTVMSAKSPVLLLGVSSAWATGGRKGIDISFKANRQDW
jgi:hypothetical protein